MANPTCNFQSIQTDIPFQLWEAITTDPGGGTPYLLTRIMHNKPLSYLLNLTACYFSYLSPAELAYRIGPFLTLALILIIYFFWKNGGKIWILLKLLILIFPLIYMFQII
jgi:hypothetical protein